MSPPGLASPTAQAAGAGTWQRVMREGTQHPQSHRWCRAALPGHVQSKGQVPVTVTAMVWGRSLG